MNIVIIGAGNWGATLAGVISPTTPVHLWCRDDQAIARGQAAVAKIAGAKQSALQVEPAFTSQLGSDDIVILAVPSSQVAAITGRIKKEVSTSYPVLVCAAKGLDRATFRTMSQVAADVLPQACVAVLSGPNIAGEIAAGRPAKAVLGCNDVNQLIRLSKAIAGDRLHLEMTRDVVDVELCAAMKGVFAIGAGVIRQRNWGCNFMGLLLTYGLAEIARVAAFLGISTTHVFGIAGLGDMVATCFSHDSRNHRLGELLAAGTNLQQALGEVDMVVEGAMTARIVSEMTALRLRLPLFEAIALIVEHPQPQAFETFERTLLEYTV